jgi:hypothetical protein
MKERKKKRERPQELSGNSRTESTRSKIKKKKKFTE